MARTAKRRRPLEPVAALYTFLARSEFRLDRSRMHEASTMLRGAGVEHLERSEFERSALASSVATLGNS